MRIDPDTCRDPDLLASEVRRLEAVIAAGESARLSQKCDCPAPDNGDNEDKIGSKLVQGAQPTLTDE